MKLLIKFARVPSLAPSLAPWLAAGLAAWLGVAPVASARAAAPTAKSKVVLALIAAAQKEFDAGSFERAGEIFLEIWHQDPSTQPAIYNAARAYQLGGRLERANDLYLELLVAPDMDPALKTKAQAQLDAIKGKRGERKADEADRAEKAGQYAAAAGLWGEAVVLAPTKVQWLLRQARALHLAGQAASALALYDRYLAGTPDSGPDRAQVQGWRAEVEPKPEPAVVAPAPPQPALPLTPPDALPDLPTPTDPPAPPAVPSATVPAAGVTQPPPEAASSMLPLSLLAGGGALIVTGVVVVALANSAEGKLAAHNGPNGRITGISLAAYTEEAHRLSGNYRVGWALTGAGVVGAGVGAWLLLREPSARVVLAPGAGGAVVVVRF
ncbi:MAG: hypothetical protein EXR79_13655 [Myxococcales bacterium]|nr:hypothetical protein [Myxococcales bacterium]